MNTGEKVKMKKALGRLGIRKGATVVVRSVDRWGRVMITFDEFFGVEVDKELGNGYLFDPNGEYKPDEYLETTDEIGAAHLATA